MKNGATDSSFAGIRKKLPFNLVGGTEDPATDKAKATRKLAARMQAMGFSNVTCTIYPGTRHESLNEINRDEVTQNFLDWLAEAFRLAASPARTCTYSNAGSNSRFLETSWFASQSMLWSPPCALQGIYT